MEDSLLHEILTSIARLETKIDRIDPLIDKIDGIREKAEEAHRKSVNNEAEIDEIKSNNRWLWRSIFTLFGSVVVYWLTKL